MLNLQQMKQGEHNFTVKAQALLFFYLNTNISIRTEPTH